MADLTPDHLALLREIAFSAAPYMVEDARVWGDDGVDVTVRAVQAEQLAAAGLIRGIGQHLEDDGPGVYTLYEATAAGREVASGGVGEVEPGPA